MSNPNFTRHKFRDLYLTWEKGAIAHFLGIIFREELTNAGPNNKQLLREYDPRLNCNVAVNGK